MKKNSKRQPCPRLRTLDSAQLATVAGGVNTAEYYQALVDLTEAALANPAGSAVNAFFAGAVKGAVTPS